MQQTDGWTDGQKKWHIEVGALKKKKEDNCKQNSLIQTLVYRSNIYYSKVYQRENWKKKKEKKSTNLHLEVRIRYFRHRYSMKLSRTSMNLKIIKPHQCSLKRSHAVLIEPKEYFQTSLMLIKTKTNP